MNAPAATPANAPTDPVEPTPTDATPPTDPLAEALENLGLDELTQDTILSVGVHNWLAILLIIFLAVTVYYASKTIAIAALNRRYKDPNDADRKTPKNITRTAKHAAIVAGATLAHWLLTLLLLPEDARNILLLATKATGLIAGVATAYDLADVTADFFEKRAKNTATRIDDILIPLVRKAAKVAIVAFGLVFIAESFSLPITSLIAGLGIGGLAFAFAAKDTVENLFGSIAVVVDRPFDVGDWINIEGTEGIVEQLGFRSTRIRTFYNSLVTVPNATLVRATVDNFGRRSFRRFTTTLNLTYATHPDDIEAFCEGIRELVRQHPDTRKDFFEVHMRDFGPHSLDVMVYIFFKVPDWSAELRARHAFCLDIVRLAHTLGIDFAFPTQTLHIARQTENPEATTRPIRTEKQTSLTAGINAASTILEHPQHNNSP